MEYRPLEITVISAKDIKDVNLFSKMDVYALVTISGDRRTQQKTPVDRDGGKNPSWNFNMKFTIDENLAKQNRLILVFQLRAERSLGDRDIGEVHVPIKELLDNLGDGKSSQFVSYQVRRPNGKAKGELNFSYKFGEKVFGEAPKVAQQGYLPQQQGYPPQAYPPPKAGKEDEPVTAYPAYPPPGAGASSAYPPPGGYPPQSSSGYPPQGYPPPPQAGYGYPPQGGYPPPGGYGYPPQQGGYPPVQQPPKKNSKLGLGLGAGLLGGALGGLLIGDMISDAGAGAGDYGGGYDGGFDSGGGFDF